MSLSVWTDLGEVLMPCPFDECCVVFHDAGQFAQPARVETFAAATRTSGCSQNLASPPSP